MSIVGNHLHINIGTLAGQRHRLDIGDLCPHLLRGGERKKTAGPPHSAKQGRTPCNSAQLTPRPAWFDCLHHYSPRPEFLLQLPTTNSCCNVRSSCTTGLVRFLCS